MPVEHFGYVRAGELSVATCPETLSANPPPEGIGEWWPDGQANGSAAAKMRGASSLDGRVRQRLFRRRLEKQNQNVERTLAHAAGAHAIHLQPIVVQRRD